MINLLNKIISPIYALDEEPLGGITGIGKFQENVTKDPAGMTEAYISTIISVLTVISGLAFLIYFLLGGLTWITAGGDKNNTAKAQKQMTDAAIGLITVIVSYFIAGIIGTIMGIDILNPASLLGSFIK